MKYLLFLVLLTTGCVAKSGYVDELAGLVQRNSKAVVDISPTQKNLETYVLVNKLSEDSSSVVSESVVKGAIGLLQNSGIAGSGIAGTVLMGLSTLYFRSKKKKAVDAGKKAASEPNAKIAHEHMKGL